jgi:hypothetical protein
MTFSVKPLSCDPGAHAAGQAERRLRALIPGSVD